MDVVHHQLAAECRHVSRSLPKLFCNLSASRADTLASNGAASPPRLRLCEKEIAGRDDANRFIFDAINNYFRQLEHVAVPLFFLISSSSHLADPLDRRICCFLCHLAGEEDLPVRLVHILHEKFRCSGNTRCLGFQSSVRFAFNSLREAPKTGEVWPFVLDLRIQLRLADEHQLTDEPGSCSFTGRLRRFCS